MFLNGVARLGRDIEVRHTANGTPVGTLALAYEYGQRNAEGQRATQWVEATLWGEQAVRLQEHLTKATVLTVSCRDVRIETFERRDGTAGHKLAATVMALEFTPRQREKEAATGHAAAPAATPRTAAPAKPRQATAPPDPVPFDDDIPF